MKQNFLFSIAISTFIGITANAQVGIGTTTPAATADITALNPTGASTNVDGILIPRVDRQRAQGMASVPNSTLIYVNSIATGTAAGQAINITSTGFYYFDTTSTTWIKIQTGATDWSLTGNAGTTAGTNFIGTTDAQDFRIKTGVGGVNRWNISNANNGQLQSYSLGTGALPAYSFQADSNTGIFSPAADNLSIATNGTEKVRVQSNGSMTIGSTYAAANAAPTSGLRVEGQSVIGKASGEDSRDTFSAHSSASAYSNITGYPSAAGKRAIAGYSDAGGMGVLGFSNSSGYGVVGLTQAGAISAFVQTGEGILGQADGAAAGIPIGNHGIIDETVAGNWKATGILGENNNIITGGGFQGGAYNGSSTGAVAGVYGNIGTRVASSGTNAFMFGVVGDILTLGGGVISDGTGGVLGFGGTGNFGMLGYRGLSGTSYSVYGGGLGGSIAAGNTGNKGENNSSPNNHIGLGINGGFMGGYVKGEQYGMVTKGKEFGMYVQGNTIVNEPIVQLIDSGNSKRTAAYTPTSTDIDVSTRGIGALNNGEAFISFKESFKNLVSKNEPVNVTVTPTSETNGVYVSKVTSEGFYIKENKGGTSSASFNWTAIGTRAGFENGIAISNTILDKNFDKNMNGVMSNDGTYKEGTPIYFDGQHVLFERIPENLIKYSTKELPKKK